MIDAIRRLPFCYQPHLVINNFVWHIFCSDATAIIVVMFFETPVIIFESYLDVKIHT